MRLLSVLPYVVFALFSHTVWAQSTDTSNNDLGHFAFFECREQSPFPRNGRPQNCARALLQGFPLSIMTGQFHIGAPVNLFQLPRTAQEGDCQVTVELIGSTPVPGSWQQIWAWANTLSAACTYPTQSGEYTGGYVHAGPFDGLAIILSRPVTVTGNESVGATE